MPPDAPFQTQNIDVLCKKAETEAFHFQLSVYFKITHQKNKKTANIISIEL